MLLSISDLSFGSSSITLVMVASPQFGRENPSALPYLSLYTDITFAASASGTGAASGIAFVVAVSTIASAA